MRCCSCNMHAMGKRKRVHISMNARAVVGVNEVNCLGCGMLGQLLIGFMRLRKHGCMRLETGLTIRIFMQYI